MQHIRVYVSGIPKGQPRAKAFSRGGHASVYDPGTAEKWKSDIAAAVQPQMLASTAFPLTGPVRVVIDHYMPRPKSHYRTGKRAGELREDAGFMPHVKTPDIDNLIKAAMDALTRLGVWVDDSQVIVVVGSKAYTHVPVINILTKPEHFPGAWLSVETFSNP